MILLVISCLQEDNGIYHDKYNSYSRWEMEKQNHMNTIVLIVVYNMILIKDDNDDNRNSKKYLYW